MIQTPQASPLVFISCHPENARWRDELLESLAAAEGEGRVRVLDADRIARLGEGYSEDRHQAIGGADEFVVLVSAAYLADRGTLDEWSTVERAVAGDPGRLVTIAVDEPVTRDKQARLPGMPAFLYTGMSYLESMSDQERRELWPDVVARILRPTPEHAQQQAVVDGLDSKAHDPDLAGVEAEQQMVARWGREQPAQSVTEPAGLLGTDGEGETRPVSDLDRFELSGSVRELFKRALGGAYYRQQRPESQTVCTTVDLLLGTLSLGVDSRFSEGFFGEAHGWLTAQVSADAFRDIFGFGYLVDDLAGIYQDHSRVSDVDLWRQGARITDSVWELVLGGIRCAESVTVEPARGPADEELEMRAHHLVAALLTIGRRAGPGYGRRAGPSYVQRGFEQLKVDIDQLKRQMSTYVARWFVDEDSQAWSRWLVPGWADPVDSQAAGKKDVSRGSEFAGRVRAHGDGPAQADRLGRSHLVQALAEMFADAEQFTPLTLAVLGNWGTGKTSVMRLVERHLKKHHKKRFDFAWFNAWEYENIPNMSAALAQEVVQGFTHGMSFWARSKLAVRYAWKEHRAQVTPVALLALAILVLGTLLVIFGWRWMSAKGPALTPHWWEAAAAMATTVVAAAGVMYKRVRSAVEHPLIAEMKTYLNLDKYGGKHLGEIPLLKRHISALRDLRLGAPIHGEDTKKSNKNKDKWRRLVVFVDDLDRCQPKSIRQTLEAIRLVMDLEHVIVVLGMDYRILSKAVAGHYQGAEDTPTAREYLAKIIQLPVVLPRPDAQALKEFVHDDLFDGAVQSKQTVAAGSADAGDLPAKQSTDQTGSTPQPVENKQEKDVLSADSAAGVVAEGAAGDGALVAKPEVSGGGMASTKQPDVGAATGAGSVDERPPSSAGSVDPMPVTIAERDAFLALAEEFLVANPRQLIRLRNAYRVLKRIRQLGHDELGAGFSAEEADPKWLMRMVFWQEFLLRKLGDTGDSPDDPWAEERPSGEAEGELTAQDQGILEAGRVGCRELYGNARVYRVVYEFARGLALPADVSPPKS